MTMETSPHGIGDIDIEIISATNEEISLAADTLEELDNVVSQLLEHDNEFHSVTFAIDGDAQPPEEHDNSAHSVTFAIDGDAQPPEEHDNSSHSVTFAIDGDAQPAENVTSTQTASGYEITIDGDTYEFIE